MPIVYDGNKSWKTVEERDYNAAWQPAPEEDAPIQIQPIAQPVEGPARARYAWMGAGLLGIALSVYGLVGTDHRKLALQIDRWEAVSSAREALSDAGIALDDSWEASVTTAVTTAPMEHSYVWRTWEPSVYQRLLGTFLSAPHWQVRFARLMRKFPWKIGRRISSIYRPHGAVDGHQYRRLGGPDQSSKKHKPARSQKRR